VRTNNVGENSNVEILPFVACDEKLVFSDEIRSAESDKAGLTTKIKDLEGL